MTADQPPAIITEQPPGDMVSLMKRLAAATPGVAEAQRILDGYTSENARLMWTAVWGLEVLTREIALRKQNPRATFPPEWRPLPPIGTAGEGQ